MKEKVITMIVFRLANLKAAAETLQEVPECQAYAEERADELETLLAYIQKLED